MWPLVALVFSALGLVLAKNSVKPQASPPSTDWGNFGRSLPPVADGNISSDEPSIIPPDTQSPIPTPSDTQTNGKNNRHHSHIERSLIQAENTQETNPVSQPGQTNDSIPWQRPDIEIPPHRPTREKPQRKFHHGS